MDDPAAPSQPVLDADQRLSALNQDGWQVQYLAYQRVQQQWLPQRLTISRAALTLKLVINDWQLRTAP